MRRIVIHPAAQLELRAAANWYSDQEAGLGEEFVLEIDRTLETLTEEAHRAAAWRSGSPYQKTLVHRFPYAVFFTHDVDHLYVLAIAHRRRKPGYWLKRSR